MTSGFGSLWRIVKFKKATCSQQTIIQTITQTKTYVQTMRKVSKLHKQLTIKIGLQFSIVCKKRVYEIREEKGERKRERERERRDREKE